MKGVHPIRDFNKFYELQKILMNDDKIRECLLLLVMYNTNLRVSDALLIRWFDILTLKGRIKTEFIVSEKKTTKKKWIPISDQLSIALQRYFDVFHPRVTDYIFRTHSRRVKKRGNQPWSRVYVYSFLKKYAKKVGIEGRIGAHTPRKTWGYHAYQSGIDIYEIMRILNHSSVRTTEVYIGLDEDKIRETYNKLADKNSRATGLFLEMSINESQKK